MTPYLDDGDVRLYHGDCREVLPLLAGSGARMIWTDPPYGLNFNNGDLAHNREAALGLPPSQHGEARPIANDGDDAVPMLREVLPMLAAACDTDCCCCCCCGGGGPRPLFADFSHALDEKPWEFQQAVVWRKGGLGMGWKYRRDYEFVLVSKRRSGKLPWFASGASAADGVSNVIETIRPKPSAEDHPTPKPVGLIEHFVRLHTQPGDLVIDPFMGHGPVAVACQNLGRRFIGIEIQEEYVEAAALRLRQLSLLGGVA